MEKSDDFLKLIGLKNKYAEKLNNVIPLKGIKCNIEKIVRNSFKKGFDIIPNGKEYFDRETIANDFREVIQKDFEKASNLKQKSFEIYYKNFEVRILPKNFEARAFLETYIVLLRKYLRNKTPDKIIN